jgi:hypothetical protein
MRTWKIWVVVIVFAAAFWACSSKKEEAVNFGQYEDGVYTNSYFGIRVPLPDTWFVMDDESRQALMQQGSKIVSGDNKNIKAVMDAADLKSMNLLAAYAHPPGSAVETNPSIIVVAEKIGHLPGIKRGSDYHYHTKKLMAQSPLSVSYPNEVYEKSIGGVPFDVMEIKYDVPQGANYQKQYCTTMKNYALLVIITYQDDDGLMRLDDILATIEFGTP